jgi:hypothetical protein
MNIKMIAARGVILGAMGFAALGLGAGFAHADQTDNPGPTSKVGSTPTSDVSSTGGALTSSVKSNNPLGVPTDQNTT